MTDEKKWRDRQATNDETIQRFLLPPDAKHDTQEINMALRQVPLTLQPFFKDQINLNQELVRRFPNMPLMSNVRFRDLYRNGERGVATLSSQDGAASLIVDVSNRTSEMQFAFMYGSMLSLRFELNELSDLDRRAWLDNMDNRQEDVVFLWGQSRWAKDYIICVPHRYYLSLLAFSQNNFEAAVRMTPALSEELFGWLRSFWYPDMPDQPDSGETSSTDILKSW